MTTATVSQDEKGRWTISGLYTKAEDNPKNVQIPVTIKYDGGGEVNYNISNKQGTKKATDWVSKIVETEEDWNEFKSKLTFESKTVTRDSDKVQYKIENIEWSMKNPPFQE